MSGSDTQLKPWLDVAYRRRYWILVPALMGLVGGLVALTQMPKVYVVSTTLTWRGQTIPEGYVQETVSTGVMDRLGTLSISMMSRPSLEAVAREIQLIPPDAKKAQIEAAVARLRRSVVPEIDPMRPPKFFKITVEDQEAKFTARVANALANSVVSQNADTRVAEARSALAMAEQTMAENKAKLELQEAAVARYRMNNMGQLPEQAGANMTRLTGIQGQITSLDSEIRRQQDMIFNLRMMPQVGVTPLGAPGLDPATARYQQLQRELADLELKYNSSYPDVARKREELQAWAKAYPHVLAPADGKAAPEATPPVTASDLQIAAAERTIKRLEQEKAALQAQIGTYESRLTGSPLRQTEMEKLTRDYDILSKDYNNWLSKVTEAKRSLALELDNQGEQFTINEKAFVPRLPSKPVPYVVILTGLAIGLAAGVGLSFLLEFLDNSVRTEEEFATAFPELPLLAAIPDLDRAARSRKRKSSGRRAAALVVIALNLSGSLPFLY